MSDALVLGAPDSLLRRNDYVDVLRLWRMDNPRHHARAADVSQAARDAQIFRPPNCCLLQVASLTFLDRGSA